MTDSPYLVPGANSISLDEELVQTFSSYQENIRENTIQLCLLAAGVRAAHLDVSGKKYDKAFEVWWRNYSLDTLFGGRNNFSKYASAGDVIAKAEGRYKAKRDQLPTTVGALYQLAQLTEQELQLCFQHTYTRKSLTASETEYGGKTTKPLIRPHTTEAQIKAWRDKWNNPPKPKTEKRTVTLAEIRIHGSIFDLDSQGTPTGKLTEPEIRQLMERIESALEGTNTVVLIESNLDKIVSGIERRKAKAAKKNSKQTKSKIKDKQGG